MPKRRNPFTKQQRLDGKSVACAFWAIRKASVSVLAMAALSVPYSALAEGSVQMGLNQELVEWGPTQTDRLIKIDILNSGEIINAAAGGGARQNSPQPNDDIRFTLLDANGVTLATHTTNGAGSVGKLSPTDPMTGLITNPWRFTTAAAGTYYLAVENTNALNDEIHRLDVTVTSNATINPDPSGNTGIVGRVSSQHWQFRAGSFDQVDATDADYFILTPGGVPNTNYVWKLDLNNFAGFGFSLRANSRGVIPPNSGFSVPFPAGSGNSGPDWVEEEFDIYLHRPVVAQPEPIAPPNVQNFTFVDDEGVDNSISPDTSATVQDTGVFSFETDVQSATYEIAIDLNGNGLFGDSGDVRLLGNAVQGTNNVPWDGRDNNGNFTAYGNFNARVSVRLGEFHFVAEDAETSGGNADGLTVFRNGVGGGDTPTNVFWDDVSLLGAGAGGTNNLPDGGLSGTAAGFHTWGDFTEGPIGDKQFIDTWVYGLSSIGTTGVVVADNDDVATVVATVDITPLSTPGDDLTLTINDPDREGDGTLTATVVNQDNGETETVTLTETGPNTGVFTANLPTNAGGAGTNNDGVLNTRPGDDVELVYEDSTTPTGTQILTDQDDVLGLVLTKTGTLQDGGDGQANVGDVIRYSFTVTNLSDVAANNVNVTDPGVIMIGGPIATLAAGANDTTTFTATYSLTQADINAGSFQNTASVSGDVPGYGQISSTSDDPTDATNTDPDGDGVPNDPTVTPLGQTASLSLLKQGAIDDGGDGTVNVGDAVDYQFTVTNTGNVAVSNITITDPLVTVNGGPIMLQPGAVDSTTFTARYTLNQADINANRVENSATVNGQDPGGNTVSDTSDDPNGTGGGPDDPTVTDLGITGQVNLEMVGTLDPGPDGVGNVGDVITYVLTVTNTGPVILNDLVITGPDLIITGGPLGPLAPGESDNTTFTAQYVLTQDDIDNGEVIRTTTVTGTTPTNDVVSDVSDDPDDLANIDPNADGNPDDPTRLPILNNPAMSLTKTAALDDGGDGWADIGDVINYSFRVSNIGNVNIDAIQINDALVTVNGGPIARLGPGQSDDMTFTAQYVLTQADLNNGSVTNTAIVTGNPTGGGSVSAVSDDPANPADDDPDNDGQPSDPTVTILPINQPPAADDDDRTTPFNTPVTFDPRENVTDPENGTLTITSFDPPADAQVVINPDGTLMVTPDNGFIGVITFPYTVCDERNNCDAANITITVNNPLATLGGTVFLDENFNDGFDAGETPRGGWIVELRDPNGNLIETTPADANGTYQFSDIDIRTHTGGNNSGDFSVTARHPETGVAYRVIGDVTLTGGLVVDDVDLPVEPMGLIYDSVDRVPVDGTLVTIATQGGVPLPDQCLRDASQQNQSTGSDGAYFFEVVPGASPLCPSGPTPYRIVLTSPPDYEEGASLLIPGNRTPVDPPAGTGPFPVVADFGVPNINADTNHHYEVTIGAGEREVTRNNIPLDPAALTLSPLAITKTAGVATATMGGVVPYTVTITNSENQAYNGVDMVDIMPSGFSYIDGSLRVNGALYPELRTARGFDVENLTIPPNQTVTLEFTAAIGSSVNIGISVNQARVESGTDGRALSDTAEASVRLLATPELDCSEVIGKVFDDHNKNGVQDRGEKGIAGITLATAKGLLIATDEYGRYHIACAAVPNAVIGSNFIIKIDPRTLPTGYRMVSENPRVIRLTRGKMSRANFAVTQPRIVTFDVETAGFVPGRIELAPYIIAELPKLIQALRIEESTLRLNYHAQGFDPLAENRLKALEDYLLRRWKTEGCCHDLNIERRLIQIKAAHKQHGYAPLPTRTMPIVPLVRRVGR
jgi:uncharacterized repeat protein (TIGR01451 family)